MLVPALHKRISELTSTNDYLWNLSEKEALPHFYSVSTDFQTKGKGQDSNQWESARGQNILLSLLINPDFLLAEDVYQISRWVSVSIVDYLKEKGIKDISIKWPNDVYVGQKKIAGILIQNAMTGDSLTKSMVGIGLNVNQTVFYSEAPNPVSIRQLTASIYDVSKEIEVLKEILKENFLKLQQHPASLIQTYHHFLYQLNQWHYYQVQGETIQGKIQGVNQFGQLILEHQGSGVFEYDIKEIKFL